MREVAVIGAGQTKFGKLYELGVREIAEEAILEAIKDSGVQPKDIETVYCGSMGMSPDTPMMIGQIAAEQAGIKGVPITRVENACASGSNAFRDAWLAIQSGLYNVALVIGIEKMSTPTLDYARFASRFGGGDAMMEGVMGFFPPGIFGMIARIRMEKYGTTRKEMALVAVKNHKHGSLNPKAHYRNIITVEDVLNSRPVSEPLNVLDCCPITDGGAAVILAAKEYVKKFKGEPVWVIGSAQVSGTYEVPEDMHPDTTKRAAKIAYEMAGVGPEDIDVAEVHDCFSVAELGHYEDLGFCKEGEAGKLISEGTTALGGKLPVNPSGGLLAKGHPIGATGVAQIVEIVQQLRGRCDKRQVNGAKIGLTHNGGGFRHGDTGIVVVNIFKKN
jgi:acetyl-CoA acetyltransferase